MGCSPYLSVNDSATYRPAKRRNQTDARTIHLLPLCFMLSLGAFLPFSLIHDIAAMYSSSSDSCRISSRITGANVETSRAIGLRPS